MSDLVAVGTGVLLALGVWLLATTLSSTSTVKEDLGMAAQKREQKRQEDLIQKVLRKDRESGHDLGDNSPFGVKLRLAEIPMTSKMYWLVMGGSALVLALIGAVLVSIPAGVILFLAVLAVTYAFVDRRAQTAKTRLQGQVASFIGTVGAALNSGLSLQAAVRRAASSLPAPLGPEVNGLLSRVALDREPMSYMFARLSVWLEVPTLGMFANALAIAEREKSTGMGRVVTGLSDDLRKTQAMEIERKAKLSSHVKVFNLFISGPILSFVAIIFFEPHFWHVLVTTSFGLVVLVAEAVTVPAAYLWMRSLTNPKDILAR